MRFFASSTPPFARHVLHVVFTCAQKQVCGIHTWRIVAVVTHVKTIRNLPTDKFPRSTVSTLQFSGVSQEPVI